MGENNNRVIAKAKDTGKKAAKKIINKLIMIALPYIIGFIICILALGVMLATVFLIKEKLSSILSIFSPTQEAPTTVLDSTQSIVSIGENGEYVINDNFSEQILEELEKQKVDNEAMEFLTNDEDEFEDMINKYIETEMRTMFPKTDVAESDMDGSIKVQRATTEGDGNAAKNLKYIKYEEFNAKVENGDSDIYDYFSLDPKDFKIYAVTGKVVTYADETSAGNVNLTVNGFDYQTLVQSYAMPFNFLISLHMIAQDADFMEELVDEAVKKDIVLTLVDTTTITETKRTYEGQGTVTNYIIDKYDKERETEKRLTKNVSNENIEVNVEDYVETDYYEKVESTNGSWEVTKADTWLQTVTKVIEDMTSTPVNSTTGPEVIYENSNVYFGMEENDNDDTYTQNHKYGNVTITETINTTTTNKRFTVANKKREIKVDDFVDFIKTYPEVEENLKSSPNLLFYMLQQNENTQKLEQIMRYVILMLSGTYYGVSADDLEDLLAEPTNMVGGDYIVHTEKGPEILKITDVETLKKAFSGYSGSEKLIEHAQDFLEMQEKYKVNAVFAAAVSIGETGAGRAGNAVNGFNNWFNIAGGSATSRWSAYSSPKGSIDDFGDQIANGSYYFTQGKYTVSQIGYVYCPNEEVAGQADKWIEDVRGFMTDMFRAAGIDVSSIFSNYGGAAGKIADVIAWAESYVGKTQYPSWNGGYADSYYTCAGFVSSAYNLNGLGTLSGSCGITLGPIGDKGNIVRNSDGTINWSQIPPGAFLVIRPGDGGSDGTYGHTVLYVGNGYVIEAGSTYVTKNKIDSAFCGSAYSFWAIPQAMTDYMNSAEYKALISAQVTTATGKGYTSQVTVNGRTYNEYKQGSPDYYGITYWEGTFADNACGPTSLGIIASGYGINQDPVSIASYMNNRWGKTAPEYIRLTITEKLGLKCTYYAGTQNGGSASNISNIIINHLKSGKPIVINAERGYYTSDSHYMTLLAINDKNEVYLSNPGDTTKNGWVDLSTLLERNGCGRCIITIDS